MCCVCVCLCCVFVLCVCLCCVVSVCVLEVIHLFQLFTVGMYYNPVICRCLYGCVTVSPSLGPAAEPGHRCHAVVLRGP